MQIHNQNRACFCKKMCFLPISDPLFNFWRPFDYRLGDQSISIREKNKIFINYTLTYFCKKLKKNEIKLKNKKMWELKKNVF